MSGLHRLRMAFAIAALSVVVPAGSLFAGQVVLGTSGWQASWDPSLDGLVQVIFDGQTSTSVTIQKLAQFVPPNGLAPIDITFTQTAPTTVNRLIIEDEVITNQTGFAWTDFHFDIVDSGDASFNPAATAASGGPPPIGFNIAPFTTAAFGNNGGGPNTTLDVGGGVVPNNSNWNPGSGPGGDGQLHINMNPHANAPFTVWTLKERPTVPEPSMLAALSISGLALLRRRSN